MSYNVVVSPDAFEGLKQAAPGVLLKLIPCIFKSLQDLGENPVGLGERSLVPYPGSGQVFYFKCAANGVSHWLAALFAYDENETDIHVLRVTYRRTIM